MAGANPTDQQEGGRQWLINIKTRFADLTSLSTDWSICKVPCKLRDMNVGAYNPQIISIGPLHHGTDNVLDMEEYKWHYALSLLERTRDPEKTLDECGEIILINHDAIVQAYYPGSIKYNRTDLAKMLLFDGFFILELFLRFSNDDAKRQDDPIFTTSWMISTLQRDLALLENQIPIFVLKELCKNIVRHTATAQLRLKELALRFFRPELITNEGIGAGIRCGDLCHLLDLLHRSYLPSSLRVEYLRGGARPWKLISCATELCAAGIKFQKDTTKHQLDLSFENDSLFRNLIAFEQSVRGCRQCMTSYALLMDRLVDTSSDVELLAKKRIIQNDLGGYEDVTDLFNNICKQVVVREFYFTQLCEQVDAYYNKSWHGYKASLKQDYFKNPWTIISFIAAILLLSLTILQTMYSVFSYYHI
ncbi:hypothetical protein NC652_041617 [Populus alba x Populus x berolinensis]|nr:hypothetical protein NC652_041617 [Populus alba x Populus x berolinensis]